MTAGLQGRRVLVVGSASGIGAGTVRACLGGGARVAGFDLAEPDPPHGTYRAWQLDVSDEAAVAAAVREAAEWLGGLDAVLHVAGIVGSEAPVDELTRSDWDRVIAVNLTGPFLVAKHTLPLLESSDSGTLALVGSGAGVHNAHPSVAYAASKAGLNGLALTLHEVWRERGVNVVAVLPTSVDTPLARKGHPDPEALSAALAGSRARHRILTADEAGEVLAFLASPAGFAVRGAMRTW